MGDFNFSIDLPVRSEWSNVDQLRASVQNCFTAIFSAVAGCHSLAMVTGELLENAIKYGDWTGVDEQRFRLRVWGHGRSAHVAVENPVDQGDDHAREVMKTLDWMRGFASPIDAYRAKLLEVAAAADRDPGASKLGLVRIAYEGNCTLTAELARGVLKVEAQMVV
jgi:hypothetical protein